MVARQCDDYLLHLWKFLCPRNKLKFSHLCQTTRRIALSKENEYTHMIECLDLTLGCWRGTGYFKENPWVWAELYNEDEYNVSPEEFNVDGATTWLAVRVAVEKEMHRNSRAPSEVSVDSFCWIRIEDRQLDVMSYRLKHFSRLWLNTGVGGHENTIVYARSDYSGAETEAVELDAAGGDISLYHAINSRTYSHESHFYDLPRTHVGVPYLARVLLQDEELVEKLCDVNNRSLTPGKFLKEIQGLAWSSEQECEGPPRIFNIEVLPLLLENTNVYCLPLKDFWRIDPNKSLGVDKEFGWAGGDLTEWLCPSKFALCGLEYEALEERAKYLTSKVPLAQDSLDWSQLSKGVKLRHNFRKAVFVTDSPMGSTPNSCLWQISSHDNKT
eukprot:Protomagalhaensia_wolfi_Nauph_80__5961@NODE_79_length_3929_cov_112_472751_g60_i0_p2_GENE_NODE_79_length_3929_cov_112_472751_g60_i0NODE_79_length_3929_cov_112_472751_g60_i0_p2_ORF_typecomplete_len385_score49_01_NODE_79_length_3929_cov_112_472751_g60_i01591313